ncbi:MAG: hypothetical protein MZV70_26780 [Desulfobacterales bacterium]|nr:hypothetical protein [Desulfobacterales bacterium]
MNDLIKKSDLKNAASVVRSLQIAGFVRMVARDKKQLSIRTQKIIGLDDSVVDPLRLTSRQQTVIDYLKNAGPTELRELMAATNTTAAIMKKLLEKGLLTVSDAEVIRKALLDSSLETPRQDFELNDEQKDALRNICLFADNTAFHPDPAARRHGQRKNGSVSFSAIDHVLKTGGTAIYLVPEIALTPQLISRITGRFDPDKIAVIHSGIAESVRYDQWRQIQRGRINLVIGARSALFCPAA